MPLMVRLPDELRERIDAARGDVPRERFIRRLLHEALDARSSVPAVKKDQDA